MRAADAARAVLEDGISSGATLAAVGGELGVTRERVRQLYREARLDRRPALAVRAKSKAERDAILLVRLTEELAREGSWQLGWVDLAIAIGCPIGDLLAVAKAAGVRKPTLNQLLVERLEQGLAWCSTCSEWKAVGLFYRNLRRPNGLQSRCVSCLAAAQRS